MRTIPRKFAGMTLVAAAVLAFGSCAYDDPYYSTVTTGYGYGHGYGGRTFTTATFIATGDPRWAYDPHVRAYYDFSRRAYYDPYLYGYYPVGYRPVVVYSAPHPYGWSPGRTRISPPSRVNTLVLRDYANRYESYRRSNYPWAGQVESRRYDRQRHAPAPTTRDSPSTYTPQRTRAVPRETSARSPVTSPRQIGTTPQTGARATWTGDTRSSRSDQRRSEIRGVR